MEKTFKIYYNIDGLGAKAESLKTILTEIKPHIVLLCETKLSEKRKFNIECYGSFQKNKNIHSGGLYLSIAKSAGGQPLDVSKTENENIISVQITCINQVIRLILAYGPQENASKDEKDKFYDDLSTEVERAKLCREQILIVRDLNAKLGYPIIKNDVYDIGTNGQLLKVIDEHELCVANTLNKCTGTWTHTRNSKNKFEKSVIDYVIMSKE